MKKLELGNKLSRGFGKVGLSLKKHSPEILVATGVVGVVASAVLACKATTKLSEITDAAKKDIDTIKEAAAHPENLPGEYTEKDKQKDLTIVYANTGLKLVKLYGPSITLGVASLGCILASNNILNKRNAALATAYATVNNSFKNYRKRVVDRFGEDLDKELKYNIKAQEVEEKVIDEKTGEEKIVKKTVKVMDLNEPSEFARFFDCGNKGWEKDPEHNLWYLKRQQSYCNDMLKARGYLFLNEVYELLGIPKSPVGQSYGWVYDEKNPKGDNYVDFGIYNVYANGRTNSAFLDGLEPVCILDFNVDGDIRYIFEKK